MPWLSLLLNHIKTTQNHIKSHSYPYYKPYTVKTTMIIIMPVLNILNLVGGLELFFYLSIICENVIIPTDFHSIIFQRGRYTTNQLSLCQY